MGQVQDRLRQISKQSRRKVQKAIEKETLQGRFLLNTSNQKKLGRSLAAAGLLDLADRTLLTPAIHEKHAAQLAERFIEQSKRSQHIRFVTLLDSLQIVDAQKILQSCEKMRSDIHAAVADTSGIWMLGVIEVEIVNLHLMRKIRELGSATETELRKLDVLEVMAKGLGKAAHSAATLALIHFHGVATANAESSFDQLRSRFNKMARWRKTARQVEIKNLSVQYGGKKKSVAQNLTDISRYITKGGNDWYGMKAYLRYKVGFDNLDVMDEDAWVAKNYRRNAQLRREVIEEGIDDVLSMTGHEIATLASVIDSLMALKRNRTGYLVHAKSGLHSRALSNASG